MSDTQAPFTIHPAARSSVKALVGFYGKSGSGKTMSALLFARGLVGPTGRIVMIDTENHRGSYYADLVPGGYSVLDLDAPFSPKRYEAAIKVAQAAADVVLVDSMTHEWSGEGGVLDMAEAELDRMSTKDGHVNWERREACKAASWIRTKMVHKQLVGYLLRAPCHVVCCLRAEEKTRFEKEKGKLKVEKDDFTTCIADPRFIFEMLINLECYERDGQGGYVHVRKVSHPKTRPCLPAEGEQVGIEHGELLAQWCASPGAAPATATAVLPAPAGAATARSLKTQLWTLLEPIHRSEDTKEGKRKVALDWLTANTILPPGQTLDTLTAEQLPKVIELTEVQLKIQAT